MAIHISTDKVPPIPTTYEGWERWTAENMRDWVSVILWDPSSKTRTSSPEAGAQLDLAIRLVHALPIVPTATSRQVKGEIVATALAATPQGDVRAALETIMEGYRFTYGDMNAWQRVKWVASHTAKDTADRINTAVEKGVARGAEESTKLSHGLPYLTVGLAGGALGLAYLVFGVRR